MIIIIIVLYSSIWPIDTSETAAATSIQRWCENNGYEKVLHVSQTARQESHHQMQYNVIPRTLNGFKYFYLTEIILFNIIRGVLVAKWLTLWTVTINIIRGVLEAKWLILSTATINIIRGELVAKWLKLSTAKINIIRGVLSAKWLILSTATINIIRGDLVAKWLILSTATNNII